MRSEVARTLCGSSLVLQVCGHQNTSHSLVFYAYRILLWKVFSPHTEVVVATADTVEAIQVVSFLDNASLHCTYTSLSVYGCVSGRLMLPAARKRACIPVQLHSPGGYDSCRDCKVRVRLGQTHGVVHLPRPALRYRVSNASFKHTPGVACTLTSCHQEQHLAQHMKNKTCIIYW